MIPSEESIRGPLARSSPRATRRTPVPTSHFIMHRETHAMCQASAVNACISRRNVYGKCAILYIRKNSIRAVAAAFRRISFLIFFAFFLDTRRQENILWNITRARVTGAVWSARHANATRSSYVSAGFQKRRSGMSEMRHLDVGGLPGGSRSL